MDDNRQTRPIFTSEERNPLAMRITMLVLAGVLLLGGALSWVTALNKKSERSQSIAGIEGSGASRAPSANISVAALPKPLVAANLSARTRAQTKQNNFWPFASPLAKDNQNKGQPAGGLKVLQPLAKNPLALSMPKGNVLPPNAAVATGTTGVAPPVVSSVSSSIFVPKSIPATTRLAASADARNALGRPDPCAPIKQFKPFPRTAKLALAGNGAGEAGGLMPKLVPPPPPTAGGGMPPEPTDGLSVAELPAPPARPSVAQQLKLVAIVGDRAILKFADRSAVKENHWPAMLTLGAGEQFESVSVVGVNGDSVTLEEDGERSVKNMEPVR